MILCEINREYLSAERLLTNYIFYCKLIVIKEALNVTFICTFVTDSEAELGLYIHEYDIHKVAGDQIENLNTVKGKANFCSVHEEITVYPT